MSSGVAGKNAWALALLILVGVVVGGFIGQLAGNVPMLSWLNYGQAFGLSSPVVLDLGIIILTLGLSINITIASILGVILAIVVYNLL